jgi:hypothetical protein
VCGRASVCVQAATTTTKQQVTLRGHAPSSKASSLVMHRSAPGMGSRAGLPPTAMTMLAAFRF